MAGNILNKKKENLKESFQNFYKIKEFHKKQNHIVDPSVMKTFTHLYED
jgi:hypothetical protein